MVYSPPTFKRVAVAIRLPKILRITSNLLAPSAKLAVNRSVHVYEVRPGRIERRSPTPVEFTRDKPILFVDIDDLIVMHEGKDVLVAAFDDHQ